MAHSYLIYHFRKLLNDENQAIMKGLASARPVKISFSYGKNENCC
jgi:hypothetical protein